MKPFKHYSPTTLADAAELAAENIGRARFVAGGTDLLGTLKEAIHPRPAETLVDLKRIPGLDSLEIRDDGLHIGALVRLRRLESDPGVQKAYGLLAEAAKAVASPQLRNMGTVGGNICQEPRCWYYRYPDNGFYCLRKGGDHCPALTGENRYHSIFGAAKVSTPPCTRECPASTDVPGYMAMLRDGDWDGAAERILQVNPMPAITGRVCPHFCQDGCNRNELDESVSIRAVERRLGDYILENADRFMTAPEDESGHTAGVIGAGPAGLACAYFMRRAGHGVTVYDRLAEPGGMLAQAIPEYRLPRRVVGRLTAALERMGVIFKLGVELGQDVSIDELAQNHDTVFVATGAWKRPAIGIEGEDLTRFGLDFLTGAALNMEPGPGERVLVIGGGNVAVDVGITARRLGASSVTMACLECRGDMPAHQWEIDQAEEEGVMVLPEWGPSRITKDGDGLKVELVRCTSVFDSDGAFCPAYDPEDVKVIRADAVMMAVGQGIDLSGLDRSLAGQRGRVRVDAFTQATDQTGLYAGGDMVTGPATVIGAVASGRRAAAGMAEKLGRPLAVPETSPVGASLSCGAEALKTSSGLVEAMTPVDDRRGGREDAETVSPAHAAVEAARCLNCGCVAVSPADVPPALVALGAEIITDRRRVPAESFFRAAVAGSTDLMPGEIVTSMVVPPLKEGSAWSFEKFRRRRSIDFPVASVAVVLEMDGGRVRSARIVLGAVAPAPVRALEAEEMLVGCRIDPETAGAAARAVVKTAAFLAENEYKIRIVEALVRRNLLAAAAHADSSR